MGLGGCRLTVSATSGQLEPSNGVTERLPRQSQVRLLWAEPAAFRGHMVQLAADENLGAQSDCLLVRAFGKLGATDPLREARIVSIRELVPA